MNHLFPCLAYFLLLISFSSYDIQAQNPCIDSSLIVPNAVCPAVYDPVCGCDGQTYGNSCEAQYIHGISSWVNGECAGNACGALKAGFSTFAITHSNTYAFSDQSLMPNGQISSWAWDFGDGISSSEQNPTHTYAAAGHYTVCLRVSTTTPNGQICEGTSCQSINLTENCSGNCTYNFEYELDSTVLHAFFDFGAIDPPFYFYVNWSLDEGAATGTGLDFVHLFNEPGIHVLCATYPTGDFTSETCTVCRAIAITQACVDSSQINPTVPCPLAFIPVCGCDGVTYDNACSAFYYGGVNSWKPGACGSICNNLFPDFTGANTGGALTVWTFDDTSVFPGGLVSSWFWDFGDGQTSMEEAPTIDFNDPGEYEVCLTVSGLFADGTQCGGSICKKITVAGPPCTDPTLIDPNVLCPAVYDPVCGCDGITYENSCVAYNYHGITSWMPGICPDLCLEPAKIDTAAPCLSIYDPVCGCDKVTYDNACYAIYYGGVRSWTKGVCCENPECEALFTVEILSGNTVLIKNQSSNAEASSLSFGDGSAPHQGVFDTITHIYPGAGAYQLCLEISNFAGSCSDTYCFILNLSSETSSPGRPVIELNIAPNPASDRTNVQVLNAHLSAAVLQDVFGKTVWQKTVSGTVFDLETSDFPPGLYLLQVQTDKGTAVRKLIIAR